MKAQFNLDDKREAQMLAVVYTSVSAAVSTQRVIPFSNDSLMMHLIESILVKTRCADVVRTARNSDVSNAAKSKTTLTLERPVFLQRCDWNAKSLTSFDLNRNSMSMSENPSGHLLQLLCVAEHPALQSPS